MEFKVFIGIDVSKKTLDFTVLVKGEKVLYKQTRNTLFVVDKTAIMNSILCWHKE